LTAKKRPGPAACAGKGGRASTGRGGPLLDSVTHFLRASRLTRKSAPSTTSRITENKNGRKVLHEMLVEDYGWPHFSADPVEWPELSKPAPAVLIG